MKYFEIDLLENFNVSYIGQIKFEEEWEHFSRHIMNEYVLYFIKEGEMFIEEDKVQYHLKKGDFLILEPNKFHKGFAKAAVQYYFIHIDETDFVMFDDMNKKELQKSIEKRRNLAISSNLTTTSYKLDTKCVLPKQHQFKHYYEIIHLLDKVCHELNHKDENFKLYCVLLTKQIIIKLNRQFNSEIVDPLKDRSRSTVKKLINYLESNVSNQLRIDDIEVYIGLNYDYMNRLFKSQTNHTIKNYFNLLRIQHAQKLILEGTKTFAEIAEHIGIEDPFYFSKFFKERTGLTPSQYKKEIYLSEENE